MMIHFLTVEIALQDSPIPLQEAIATALHQQGEPLRWAITAVDGDRQIATVEAVILKADPLQ